MRRNKEPEHPWNPNIPTVPVDKDGNWIAYPTYEHASWETIHQPFWAELEIAGMETGRSAKRVILKDSNGKKYPMFVSDLIGGIQNGDFEVSAGKITAYWTGSKRGANYGIKAVRV